MSRKGKRRCPPPFLEALHPNKLSDTLFTLFRQPIPIYNLDMVSALAIAALALKSGIYECPGDPNICDQEVRVHATGSKIDYLKVEYVGWCGSMGPYPYSCLNNTCGDGNAEFVITGKNTYHWRNMGYPYQCDFKLKK